MKPTMSMPIDITIGTDWRKVQDDFFGEDLAIKDELVTSEPLIKDEDLVYVETEEQLLESMSPARVGGWSRKALRCGGQTHDTQGTKPKGKKHLGGQ